MNETAPKLVLDDYYKANRVIYPLYLLITVILGSISYHKFGMGVKIYVALAVGLLLLLLCILSSKREYITMTEETITIERTGKDTMVCRWDDIHWRAYYKSSLARKHRNPTSVTFWVERPSTVTEEKTTGLWRRLMGENNKLDLPDDSMWAQIALLCCPNPPENETDKPQLKYRTLNPDFILTPKQKKRHQKVKLISYILCVTLFMTALWVYLLTEFHGDTIFSPAFVLALIGGPIGTFAVSEHDVAVRSFAAEVFQRRALSKGDAK